MNDRLVMLGAVVLAAGMGAVALSTLHGRESAQAGVVRVPRHRVDLSTAQASELAMLPEVGPSLAARIVADRARNGGFPTLADLSRVRGVGPSTLEALRPDARAGRMP